MKFNQKKSVLSRITTPLKNLFKLGLNDHQIEFVVDGKTFRYTAGEGRFVPPVKIPAPKPKFILKTSQGQREYFASPNYCSPLEFFEFFEDVYVPNLSHGVDYTAAEVTSWDFFDELEDSDQEIAVSILDDLIKANYLPITFGSQPNTYRLK